MRKRYLAAGECSTKWTLLAAYSGPPGPLVQYVKVDLPKAGLDRGSLPRSISHAGSSEALRMEWARPGVDMHREGGGQDGARNSPHAQTLVYAKFAGLQLITP